MAKEKVNWRNEYKLDNIFNIVTGVMSIVILIVDIDPYFVTFPIAIGLFINLSANGFFRSKKYY